MVIRCKNLLALLTVALRALSPASVLAQSGVQFVLAPNQVQVVEKADSGRLVTTLQSNELYPVGEGRVGKWENWLRVLLPGCDSCWVQESEVRPVKQAKQFDWARRVYAFVDPASSSTMTLYVSEPLDGQPEALLLYGDKHSLATSSVELRPHVRTTLRIPEVARAAAPEQWTLVMLDRSQQLVSGRLLVPHSTPRVVADLPPSAIMLTAQDMPTVEASLSAPIDPDSVVYGGDPAIQPVPGNDPQRIRFKIRGNLWAEEGGSSILVGSFYARTPNGAAVEIPLHLEISTGWLGTSFAPTIRQIRFAFLFLVLVLVVILGGHRLSKRVDRWRKELSERRRIERDFWVNASSALQEFKTTFSLIDQSIKNLTQQIITLVQQLPIKLGKLGEGAGPGWGNFNDFQTTIVGKMADLLSAEKDLVESNRSLATAFSSVVGQLREGVEEVHHHELDHLKQELAAKENQAQQLVKWEEDRTRLEARVAELENKNRTLRAALVFLNEGDDGPIQQAIESFLTLERRFVEIRGVFQTLRDSWRVWPEGARFSADPVDPALEAWVSERRMELEALLEHGFSGAPELAQHLAGREMTASELVTELRPRFYFRAVANRLDRTLRELQHFYIYGCIRELREEQARTYKQACAEVREYEAAVRTTLTALGVQPIALNLLQRVPEPIVQYVSYCEKVSAEGFFAGWPGARELPGGVVIDVVRWAYLNSERRLWNDAKAQLVLSS